MILTEYVDVKIINHNINHYRDLGYDVKYLDTIKVPLNHLTKSSHCKILVECDICGKRRFIKYNHFNQRKLTNKYLCSKCVKEENKKTNLKKYGVENVSQSNIIKEKKKETNLKNWGVENVFQSENIKNKLKKTRIKNGNQIKDEELSDFYLYKRTVNNITRRVKKYLFEKWDGYDFYDKEYIKNNKNHLNRNYPTIDHKISIYNGFKENIIPLIIGDIDNLCITKKHLNCSKHIKNKFVIKNNKNNEKNIRKCNN